MNLSARRVAAALVLLALACTACRTSEAPVSREEIAKLDLSNERQERREFGHRMLGLAWSGQFDRLEEIAANARDARAAYPSGEWMIEAFYDGFGGEGSELDDAAWEKSIARIEQWRSERPGSKTASIALASAWVGYAWHARGYGYANTVTERGASDLRARLRTAKAVAAEARQLPGDDPAWYGAQASIALGEGWAREEIEPLLLEGIRKFPEDFAIYGAMAWYLMPRWYGHPGEWESFMERIVKEDAGGYGHEAYAKTVWRMQDLYRNVFRQSRASWTLTRLGYDDLVTRSPNSLRLRSEYTFLAWKAGDRGTATRLFGQLGDQCDVSVWVTPENFVRARRWASGD